MKSERYLFRGKRLKDGAWIFGDLVHATDKRRRAILINNANTYDERAVWFDSVGQFTGLLDHYGNRIFEGDILSFGNDDCSGFDIAADNPPLICLYADGGFVVVEARNYSRQMGHDTIAGCEIMELSPGYCQKHYKVIGNIHDNPEMLRPD